MQDIDEVRFHPSEVDFHRLDFAQDRHFAFGAEVPVVPLTESYQYLLKLADYLDTIGANFLNLNELELCEPNRESLESHGLTLRKESIASVAGSQEQASKFLEEFSPHGPLTVHYCPVAVKDGVQMRNRYLRRAHHIAYPFEECDR